MKRHEVKEALDSIAEMSEHEVAINAQFIKQVAVEALAQLGNAGKVAYDNRKLRMTVDNLQRRIKNLEQRQNGGSE